MAAVENLVRALCGMIIASFAGLRSPQAIQSYPLDPFIIKRLSGLIKVHQCLALDLRLNSEKLLYCFILQSKK